MEGQRGGPADPLSGGVPRATLRGLGGRRWRREIVDLVLATLAAEGIVSGDDRIARVAARPAGRDPIEERVLAVITQAGLKGVSE